jgi:hypothetical protein
MPVTRRKANSAATVTPIREVAPLPEPSAAISNDTFPEELDPERRYDESVETDPMAFERAGRAAKSPVTVTAPPVTPPAAKPRAPTQRRVSAEVVKAETKLLSLERRRQESLAHHDEVWAGKRASLLLSLPGDVLAALEAMKVLSADEVAAVDPEPDGD